MKHLRLPMIVTILVLAGVLAGCVSTEEAGPGDRARSPQHTPVRAQIQPTRPAIVDSAARVSADTLPPVTTKRGVPRFRTRQDTVYASTVRRPRPASKVTIPIVRPENPRYTVQVGAFARAANAARYERLLRRRFPDQQIINAFVESARLYRVSVGRFESRRTAEQFRRELIRQNSSEYAQCWVNYIAR